MPTNEEIAEKHADNYNAKHHLPRTNYINVKEPILDACPEVRADERNKLKEVLKKIREDCQISEHTHLCVRKIPKTDEELISQLRGAQANIIRRIETQLDGQ